MWILWWGFIHLRPATTNVRWYGSKWHSLALTHASGKSQPGPPRNFPCIIKPLSALWRRGRHHRSRVRYFSNYTHLSMFPTRVCRQHTCYLAHLSWSIFEINSKYSPRAPCLQLTGRVSDFWIDFTYVSKDAHSTKMENPLYFFKNYSKLCKIQVQEITLELFSLRQFIIRGFPSTRGEHSLTCPGQVQGRMDETYLTSLC